MISTRRRARERGERGLHLGVHLGVEAVQPLGPVQREARDTPRTSNSMFW
jgi:hypothetical protein